MYDLILYKTHQGGIEPDKPDLALLPLANSYIPSMLTCKDVN
jgi:hypothetical protein